MGAWVEANPDLQGLAAWVPTPAQVAADRAKVERARLQCLCGLVEHFADAAAEAVRWQRFDDATRLSRATEALDKAASAASAARAAATEARRALDASISTLPADDAVRLSCSRRVALAGASAVETTADIAAARVRFDFQVGAANTMSKSRAVLEVSAASLEAGDLDHASATAVEALAGARRILQDADATTTTTTAPLLGSDQVTAASEIAEVRGGD